MTIKLWAAVFCLTILSLRSNGQLVIRGSVKDSLGKPINYATVTVANTRSVVKGYALTNGNGTFSITIPDSLRRSALTLQARSIGYRKKSIAMQFDRSQYDIILSTDTRSLAPVTIKGERIPIKIRGDTITYNAKAFSSPTDRVLEDILKKMPGIRVDDNGKISYNGKSIANLYLDGDNLLDDKYAIGTKNIPNTAVDKVQVLDNHQPINALVGKVYSTQVDINIIFRDSAKLKPINEAALGAGLPGNYDVMLNNMLFKGNYKAINYIKANNVGYDLSTEVNSFNLDDKLKNLDVLPPDNLLSVSTVEKPYLPVYRYLFNNNAILNFNNLVALSKDVKLKLNLYYLHDRQQQNFQSSTTTYLPGDTIRYTERQSNRLQPDLLHAGLNLNVNKKTYYINNNFSADINKQNIISQLNTNGIAESQGLTSKVQNFSNDFNYIGSKKDQIFELYSYINYIGQPQNLTISPGPDSGFFNNGLPYTGLRQTVNTPSFFTNNYITFGFANTKFQQLYKIGVTTANQELTSGLVKTLTDGTLQPAIDSAVNDLNWRRYREYLEGDYNWITDRLKVTMRLPLSFQQLKYSDSSYHYQNALSGLIFDPVINFKASNGAEDSWGFSYRNTTEFGNINDVYAGDILFNFRSLYSNSGVLPKSNSNVFGFSYNFRRGLKLMFLNLSAFYTIRNANTISTTILNDNFEQRVILPFNNRTNSFNSNLSFSKLLFGLQTTLNARLGWQFDQTNNIVNNALLGYSNYITTATLSTDSKLTDRIFFKYYATYTYFESTQKSGPAVAGFNQHINQLNEKWELNLGAAKNLNLKLVGDFYRNEEPNSNYTSYLFADATVQYKLVHQKIDLEASLLNIGNVNTFDVTSVSSYAITNSSYKIQGRIAMLKALFSF
ncbi:MAG: carboxypeptidase-like regulatory domain-containing protein [Sphingobacteriales bacterium]